MKDIQALTPPKLARAWGVGDETIRRLIRSGQLEAFNLARPEAKVPRYLISAESIRNFQKAGRGKVDAVKTNKARPKRSAKPRAGFVDHFAD